MIPVGFCQCGCGKQTKISRYRDASHGYERNTPRPYAAGHNGFGKRPTIQRLFAKIKKTESCWLWLGRPGPGGYGRIMVRRKKWQAHRLLWTVVNGMIPAGLFVLHKCDNASCVRPDHLFLGTQKENLHDMSNKGRSLRGERNVKAKLSEQQIIEIRKRYFAGESQVSLMKFYPVDRGHISRIVNRICWKHIQ